MATDAQLAKIEKLGQDNKCKKLFKLMKEPEVGTRCAAAEALGIAGTFEAYNILISSLNDPSNEVREWIINALIKIGRRTAIDHVRHQMEVASDTEYKAFCRDAISKLANPVKD